MANASAPAPGPASDAHASFVGKLVADPKQPPNTLLLTGFLGASSDEGHTRLYFDPQLSDYVEIPDDAILHRQDVPAGLSPLGASYVWVRRDATLIHGPIGPDRLKASFLEGRLARDHAAAATGGFVPHIPPQTAPVLCDPTRVGPGCHPTNALACATQPANCPPTSPAAGCPSPTTPAAGCASPTTPGAGCPAPTSPALCRPVTVVAAHCGPFTHVDPNCRSTLAGPFCHSTLPQCRPTHVEPCQPTEYIHCPTGYGACPIPPYPDQAHAAANAVAAHGVTLAAPACLVTHVGCPATHVGPLCLPTAVAPLCHPTLSGPACAVTHVGCPPITLPPLCPLPTLAGPGCPATHIGCPPVTVPPQCVPHTIAGPACPVTHLVCPPVTVPPHCLPQTVAGPACGHTILVQACGGVTAAVVCQLTHGGPACTPATGLPGCAPSIAGCPSGIACNPGTIVNPGLPGAAG